MTGIAPRPQPDVFDSSGAEGDSGRRERPTRGRVVEALLIGAGTQTAIAALWVTTGSVRGTLNVLFIAGIGLAVVVAQRRLTGIARLFWAGLAGFWAGVAFWVTSVPLTLRSTPQVRAMAYPLFMTETGWYAASDLLPLVLTTTTMGIVAGTFGWIVWGLRWARRPVADRQTLKEPGGRAVSPDLISPPAPSSGTEGMGADPAGSRAQHRDDDASRARWGPPTDR